tara:strand:- start:495 stop:2012 length:1518 start_codon:yes stop_codon:yes gene_type:complete
MPGIGAMATALSAVPVMGLIAAGSLMAAAGTYSSHLRYQQAGMSSAAFLGNAQGALGVPGAMAAGARGEVAAERAKYDAEQARNWQDVKEARSARYSPIPSEWSGDVTAGGRPIQAPPVSAEAQREAAVGAATRRIIAGKAALPGRLAAAAARGRRGAISDWFTPGAYTSAGRAYGLDPSASLQQAASMSQAAVRPVTGSEFSFGLAAQTAFGVGLGTTGTFMGQTEYAGLNASRSADVAAQAIGSAVARGLQGTEITTYLSRMASLMEVQVNQGRNVDVESVIRMEERLTNSGVRGFRAGAITSQFGAAGADIGFRGPKSAVEYRLMESMGFTGKGGFEEYAQFRLQMQDAGNVANAMPAFVDHFKKRSAGMGPAGKALMLQQAFKALSTSLGPQEAAALAQGMAGADFGDGVTAADIMGAGTGIAGTLGSSLQAEAGIEAGRIGVGGRVAKSMQNLSRVTINMASTFENTMGTALDIVTDKLDDFAAAVERATRAGGEKKAKQ